MVRITAKQDGFRRGGVAHSKNATEYPDDTFSKKELEDLKSEPMLVVEVLTDPPVKNARPNVADTIVLVQAAVTIAALDALAEGEDRKGAQDAIAKRRSELIPG